MKNYLQCLFSFLILSNILLAQTIITHENLKDNKYTLNFQIQPPNYKIINKDGTKIINFPGYVDESKPGEFVSPSKELFIPIPVNTHPHINLTVDKKISIKGRPSVNPVVESINDSVVNYKYLDLPNKYEKKSLFKIKGYLWIGHHYCLQIRINLTDYDLPSNTTFINNVFTVTLSFKNSVKKGTNAVARKNILFDKILMKNIFYNNTGTPNYSLDSTGSWIDYSKTYVKIGVAKDAIYRIHPQDLTALGINISLINPLTFKLINKGIEFPIYVQGENDGHFDPGDYIEFVGIRNMGGHHREVAQYGHPYNEYLGRYTDTTIYWLTWDGTNGKRVIISTGGLQLNTTDTLKYYSQIVHNEINNWFDFSMQDEVRREMPYWWENKSWFQGQIGVGTRPRNFSVSDVYPNQTVKLFAKVQDYASNIYTDAHLLALSINSDPIVYDSGYINKYETKVLSAEVNSNLLTAGNNTLYIHYYPTQANPNTCQIDWDEEEYPRYIKAINDSLNFQFNYLIGNSVRVITVTNVNSSNIIYWKYGSSFKKYELNLQNNSLTLKDTVDKDNKFEMVDEQKVSSPKFYYAKQFINLRSTANSAEYLAITNKKFWAECQNYIQFIAQSYNITTKVIDVDDIYDEFAYGYFNPESIRAFLEATQMYWQDPKPQYIFLIGSATYDYYGYKTKNFGAPPKYNYVPSFGAPVSDNWFVIFDSTGADIPQLNIGRLPCSTNQQFEDYFQKHQTYVQQDFNYWNKNYLFFSGGNFTDSSQIALLKSVNNFVIDNYVVPAPIGGNYHHFYKTVNPVTNFGPYSPEEVNNAIQAGAILISYLGHSGTQTWDNSITEASQLSNNTNRYSLITDFGCSTAKFAEPDVTSFSEMFTLTSYGQAINYIGNSSLGFTSTATTYPQLFYKEVLQDSVYNISEAHNLAKFDLISLFGSSETNELFALSNTLVGDPIISLPIPIKPNLTVDSKDLKFFDNSITDNMDSIHVRLLYHNLGSVPADTFSISVKDDYTSNPYSLVFHKQVPLYVDSIDFYLPVKERPGLHQLSFTLDSDNNINEIYENDNTLTYNLIVASSQIRVLLPYRIENTVSNSVTLLSPTANPAQNQFQMEFDHSADFSNPLQTEMSLDTFYTRINLNSILNNGSRYWMRARIINSEKYNEPKSFYYSDSVKYKLYDSTGFEQSNFKNLSYQTNRILLDTIKVIFKAFSAGFNDGNSAIIEKNSQNYIPENTLRGHHVCVFMDSTYDFVTYKHFDLLGGGDSTANNYINFLDTLTSNEIVIFAVSDEGRVTNQQLRDAIKQFGSVYIDSLPFRGSWAMIGKKGAAPGSVQEAFSVPFQGSVTVDTTIQYVATQGFLTSSQIGPSSHWQNLNTSINTPSNSSITFRPLGIKNDGSIDTLNYLTLNNGIADLSSINANTYPHIKILAGFNAASDGQSPTLSSLGVNYIGVPELGTNYQVVSISADTITIGESTNLNFKVFNVGEIPADSFKVLVELVKPDNSHQQLYESTIASLDTFANKDFNVNYNSIGGPTGSMYFYITIDPENKIREIYKDNNYFSDPFYVKQDTSRPSIKITFNGENILDGDYVSSHPTIRIEMNDQSLIPITDPADLELYLNDSLITYSSNTDTLSYQFSNSNPKVVAVYKPYLHNGIYTLKVIGKNALGSYADSSGIIKKFTVSNEAQLLDVYNYPNPFKGDTYFTFKLTQIPDEIRIKIYTIAGRLIQEIKVPSSRLRYDFNKIYWNGRDHDNDIIANGVYLYKVIMTLGSKNLEVTQKLAVVR